MRDYALGTTFDIKFTTRAFATGAPATLAGTPVISAYPDNSTTQLTAGITLSVDFDSVTGLNNVRVVATSGNGYASGSNYTLVITTGTVSSTSVVGECVGEFSLEAQSPLRPTVAGRTVDVSTTGEAGVDWANVGSPTTANALTGTTIATTQKVDVETIKTQAVTLAGAITFPAATVASTTNITAGTITTTTNLTNLPSIPANWLTAAGTAADFGTEIAAAIWQDAVAGDFTVASSIGKSLYTGNVVPGGTNGLFIAGTNAATTVTTTLTTTFTGNLTGSVASVTGAVGSVTGAVGSVGAGGIAASTFAAGAIDAAAIAANAIGASELAADAATEIADAILDRDMSTGTDSGSSTVRTARQALRFLRNKWTVSAGSLTIYKEDDTTSSWTGTVTSDATANPIISNDPAG